MGMVLQHRPPHVMQQQPQQLQQQQQQQQQQMLIGMQQQGQGVNQASPLLAQQLVGRPPGPGQHPDSQPQPQLQQQSQVPGGAPVNPDDLDNLDALDGGHHDLGDLGVGGEDLLGMGEDFDIMEFADALDNLDDLSGDEDNDSKKSDGESDSAPPSSASSPVSAAPPTPVDSSPSGSLPPQSVSQRAPQQPPPYTVVSSAPGQMVRGPPPPYPGQNFGPNPPSGPSGPRVSCLYSFFFLLIFICFKTNKLKISFCSNIHIQNSNCIRKLNSQALV